MFEGADRCGKSTQAAALADYLQKSGADVLHTREPGGTPFAEAVRKIVLDPAHSVHPVAELLLYEASRAQHTHEKIIPALEAGKIVICERYTMSTAAYQGYGRNLSMAVIKKLNDIATSSVKPDLTVVFTMPDKNFTTRGKNLPSDRLERENDAFRLRVRKGFRELAKTTKGAMLINADRPIEKITAELIKKVTAMQAVKKLLSHES